MPPSREDRTEIARWANLENLLLGRTLHVQGLSPLHVPTQHTHSLHSANRSDGEDEEITSADLQRMAEQMLRFLTLRVTNIVLDSTGGNGSEQGGDGGGAGQRQLSQTLGHGFIRQVRASFVDIPVDEDGAKGMDLDLDDATSATAPRPFAIEIEIQPPSEEVVNPYANFKKQSSRSRAPARQHAHLLFVSTSKRATSTHYPLLLWKAPPAVAFGTPLPSALLQMQDQGGANANDLDPTASTNAQPTLTARVLIAHALDFVTRYFDCNLSQQGPLSSLRAAHLESTAEAIVRYHRRHGDVLSEADEESNADMSVGRFAIDVGYALPSQLTSDIDAGALPRAGPAPDLNLITLEVPAKIVQELLRDSDQDSLFLPALQHYLASVTSLQLSRLTLVRVGIANIYLGAPTNATLAGPQLGQSSAEIRLKISPLPGKGKTTTSERNSKRLSRSEQSAPSSAETRRIAMVVRNLVHAAEVDDW